MTNVEVDLTTDSFDEVVSTQGGLVLVDFWAEWCSPCVAYEPVIADVVAEREDRVRLGRVDIVEEPDLAERCGVKTIPAIAVFRDGEIVKRIFGVRSRKQLADELDRQLAQA